MTMTNKEAIKQEFYTASTGLPEKTRRQQFQKKSLRVAALEHAIMELAGKTR